MGFLPLWLLLTALVAGAAWLALRRFQPVLTGLPRGRGDAFSQVLYRPLQDRTDWFWLTGGCVLLLLATDWQGFTQGFFRWDDFSFIQATRETASLPRLLNLYHSDHSLPLFRLWVAGVVAWAGPLATADELARAFNLVNFLTSLGVLLAGAALLAECGARRITVVCFCVFAWCWPGWGEFTTGFYTLIVYPQTMVCGLAAIVLLLRYQRIGAGGLLLRYQRIGAGGLMAAGLLCTLLACGLDISGVWVFPALGGFLWARGGWVSPTVRRLAPWLALAFLLAAYYHLVWFKHPMAGRELVQNPGGSALNHSLLGNLQAHGLRLPLTIVSGLGGTLLSLITPGVLGMVAPEFYGHALRSAPIYAAEVLALGSAGWVVWRSRDRLAPADRRLLVALALPVLILVTMTAVARVHGLDLPGSLWPTKYLCVPQAWAVLAGVFLLDRTALGTPEQARAAARWIGGALLAGVWLTVTFWHLEQALDIPPARRPAGRQGNTQAALLRRADFATFQRNLEELARRTGQKQLEVPPPEGIYWAHPNLEFGQSSVSGACYLFTDLLSVAPKTGLTLRERPRAEVAPATLRAIESIPSLHRVFDPTPPPS